MDSIDELIKARYAAGDEFEEIAARVGETMEAFRRHIIAITTEDVFNDKKPREKLYTLRASRRGLRTLIGRPEK